MPRTQQFEVDLETSDGVIRLPVHVARRKGIKHLRVAVDLYNEVTLNIPPRVSVAHGISFLRDQADWVVRVIRKSPPPTSILAHLQARGRLSGLGREFELTLAPDSAPRVVIDLENWKLRLAYLSNAPHDPQLVKGLRRFAGIVIPRRVRQLAGLVGQSFTRVSVRDQRSRWGSCSERGGLSFNWRMVLLDPPQHDHLIYHELAHLTHLNHSPDYWNLVRQYDPDLDRNDRAITEASGVLMRLGRSPSARAEPVNGGLTNDSR